ncbi:hypothetical protein HHK36_015721 [Tetracentron sinense]|uniref:Methyltransferase n=1 Tax=Tetracentron sinense TaxID=13715 RepID=A0A834Z5I1_TETSI|nr:hypothetical protein HHK36_015721 [Tetracentron sinense]
MKPAMYIKKRRGRVGRCYCCATIILSLDAFLRSPVVYGGSTRLDSWDSMTKVAGWTVAGRFEERRWKKAKGFAYNQEVLGNAALEDRVLATQMEQPSDSYRVFLILCNRQFLMGVTLPWKRERVFLKLAFQVKRVLKPGGLYLFVEHVAAQDGTTLRFLQGVLDPLQ